MKNLKLSPTFPGGVETFLGNWEDVIEDLQDVKQASNDFLERTLLKAAIVDESYQTAITNLDMVKPVPSPDVCKAEIRRKGAKIESARGNKAVRKANFTSHWDYYEQDYDDFQEFGGVEDDEVTDAAYCIIAAARQKCRSSLRPSYWGSSDGSSNPLDHQ